MDWTKPRKSWRPKKPVIHVRGPHVVTIKEEVVLPKFTRWSSKPQMKLALALMKRGFRVEGEVPYAGGRSMAGGQVWDIWLPDFGQKGTVVRVQGEYWHTVGNARAKDDAQSIYLHALNINVIDVWVHDIEQRLGWVLNQLIGSPLG